MSRSSVAAFCVILVLSLRLGAQEQVVRIWPGLAPGTGNAKDEEKIVGSSIEKVYQPDLTVFLPGRPDANRPAVLVFPGGGYTHLAFEKEGMKIAGWLNDSGVAAFVLKYRLDPVAALADARRAVSYVRSRYAEFGVDRARIGVIGFSAGGHLAANLATHYKPDSVTDSIDSTSCRPDFIILVYAAIRSDILKNVGSETPPAFIVHASDDKRVPVSESLGFYAALHNAGVPCELHVFETGGHGFALEPDRGSVVSWGGLCMQWLSERNVLGAAHPEK